MRNSRPFTGLPRRTKNYSRSLPLPKATANHQSILARKVTGGHSTNNLSKRWHTSVAGSSGIGSWTEAILPPHTCEYKDEKDSHGPNGADLFHSAMREHGVNYIFGCPGNAIRPILDAINQSPHVHSVFARHEQNAGHMAQGYARVTGKTGVLLVNARSAATNLITPLQDALMDGTPLVAFCGQDHIEAHHTSTADATDMMSIGGACTKWTVTVKNAAELPQRIRDAFDIANSGRPGPVLVILPESTLRDQAVFHKPVRTAVMSYTRSRLAQTESAEQLNKAIDAAAKLINQAQSPVIFAGQGVVNSPDGPAALKQLAEKACIPVATTLQGLGCFDEEDPKALHMVGLHGSGYANMSIQNADLVIALGVRFDDRVTGNLAKYVPKALRAAAEKRGGIIHFEIAPKSINKIVQVTEAVVGDVGTNLNLMLPHIKDVASRPEWMGRVADWKQKFEWTSEEKEDGNSRIRPEAVLDGLSRMTKHMKDRTIITTGVGQHQMWAAQYFRWRYPRTMVTSGGLGTMGFGLPSAIGAKIGRPDALVIDIDGDASICMSLNELSTAAKNNLAVKSIILNNEEQGMVTQLQDFYFKSRYAHSHQKNPDFVGVAKAMGVEAARVQRLDELDKGISWLIDQPGAAVLEVLVDSKVPVLPTVPSGKGLDEFIY